jgi:hypothetical protein
MAGRLEKHFPDFNDVIARIQQTTMSRLNCHNIGKIIEFEPETQTCTIQLMQQEQLGDNIYTPAPLTEVPLILYGIEGAHITLPNPVGSICLVLFLDRNIDAFMRTGEIYTPETKRTHDYTDCVALTTFKTLVNPIENYDTEAISIIYDKLIEEILYTSVIKNYGNSLLLKVSTEETSAQIAVDDKINIQNTNQNLATLIQNLIATIKALTVNTNSGVVTPTSQNALQTIADNFSELLK